MLGNLASDAVKEKNWTKQMNNRSLVNYRTIFLLVVRLVYLVKLRSKFCKTAALVELRLCEKRVPCRARNNESTYDKQNEVGKKAAN